MKVLMRALGKLQNQLFGRRPAKSFRKTLRSSEKPKNGLLILGVLVTIAIMAGLTVFNLRLIRDQICASKQSLEKTIPEKVVTIVPERAAVDSKPEDRLSHPNTEVTFYKELKCEDDSKSPDNSSHKLKLADTGNKSSTKDNERQEPKTAKDELGFAVPALSGKTCPVSPETNSSSVTTNAGSKVYSVQVGVFSYPKVAQEWAEKWRSKGYPVALRPTARPNAGIQYRLFVGEFNSEKKADEFAKQLKAKEGVSGLTLVIKN